MNNIVYSSDRKTKARRPDITKDALDARRYPYRTDKRGRHHIHRVSIPEKALDRLWARIERKPSLSIWTVGTACGVSHRATPERQAAQREKQRQKAENAKRKKGQNAG